MMFETRAFVSKRPIPYESCTEVQVIKLKLGCWIPGFPDPEGADISTTVADISTTVLKLI